MSKIHRLQIGNINKDDTYIEDLDLFFNKQSYLTIHINFIDENWIIEELIDCNSVIWTFNNSSSVTSLSCSSVGKLGNLPLVMLRYAIKVAKNLGIFELFITGKVFKMKNQMFPSWNPVNYKILEDNKFKDFPTTDELLNETKNIPKVNTYEEINKILTPSILFFGLNKNIDELFDTMKKQNKNFESCFVIWEDGSWGFKW
jgi:hypothetical protein